MKIQIGKFTGGSPGEGKSADSCLAVRHASEPTGLSKPFNSRQVSGHNVIDANQREAILQSVHAERKRILQLKRLGEASDADLDYLSDLHEYINQWEESEAPRLDVTVWNRSEELANSILQLDVKARERGR